MRSLLSLLPLLPVLPLVSAHGRAHPSLSGSLPLAERSLLGPDPGLAPITSNATSSERASLPSKAQRAQFVEALRKKGKKGKIAAQWYPGSCSPFSPLSRPGGARGS